MAFAGRLVAAWQAWRTFGEHTVLTDQAQLDRYALLGAMYSGVWRADPRWPWADVPADVYYNARQVTKHTGAIVDLYEQLVWQGDLSTDGKPLPDGTRGAIPVDPQTADEQTNDALLKAFFSLYAMWQWRGMMSLIPKTAAIFGDVLVELVDDIDRGTVMPRIIYPGYVPDADLVMDSVGNIKQYALEYPVVIPESSAFGRAQRAESYIYRKEVDGEMYRYYKDGEPFDYYGAGAEVPNPYGFVPACLFRHEVVVGSNRGIGAYECTIMQALELNSLLSAAKDYQMKNFAAPIGVIGATALRPGQTVTFPGGITLTRQMREPDVADTRRALAQNQSLLPLSSDGKFVSLNFDIGKTMTMVEDLMGRLIAENPEAEWANKLFGMTQATGPGMQRVLSPIIGKVEMARKNHDPQMVKLSQMGTAIMGYRLQTGAFPAEIVNARPDRYRPFAQFNLDSYGRGMLDATLASRPVFPETKVEKAQWLAVADTLTQPWTLRELGVDEEDILRQTGGSQEGEEGDAQLLRSGMGENGGGGGETAGEARSPERGSSLPGQ